MKGVVALLSIAATGLWIAQAPAPENLFAPAASDKAVAVAVGVSRYQALPKDQWLEFADADALALSKYLASGQGLSFPADRVFTVTNDQATRAQVRHLLGVKLMRAVKPGDSVAIFLATHGVVEAEGSRDAYLVAYDTSLENLFDTGVSFPELQDIIQRRLGKAARIFLMVDACRAGKLAEARAFHERVAEMKRAEIFGLVASAPNESSAEGLMFGGGHGAFTYYLLRGLQGDADSNHNGFVEWSEAARYVKEQVPAATRENQHPKELGVPSSDFVLSLVRQERADLGFAAAAQPTLATLVLNGPPSTEVYVDGVSRGVVPAGGQLSVAALTADNHKLMVVTSRGLRVVEEVQVSANPTEVQFNGTGLWVRTTKLRGLSVGGVSSLLARFRDALARNRLLEPPGESALDLLRRMPAAGATPQQIQEATDALLVALEDEGQQVLLAYLKGDAVPLAAEDFDRCAALYAAAADLSPEPEPLRARRAFCEARARLYRRQYAPATALLEESVRLEPRGAYAYNALGIGHLQQGQYREALPQFEAAAQRAPRWAYPHFNTALAYTALGQFARAEEAYRRAIQLGPRYAYLHYSLAGLYMKINQPARAEQEYRRALELDLDAAAGHNMLGNFFRSRERDREAETEYRRALAFHAGDLPARLNLARLYRDQRRPREAETELLEALKRVEAALIHAALGDLYLEMRRPADAAAQYRQAAALAPDETSRAAFEEKARKAAR